jgi:hypothetical protein
MDFADFYKQLSREERKQFADRARTSPEYIEIHLLPRRKMPRRSTMLALASASQGEVSYEDVVRYFLLSAAA